MSCPACFSGSLHEGKPVGSDVSLPGDVPAYYSGPPASSTKVIMILSDVFGHTFINVRLLADTYAARGFHVFVPDILGGSPIPPESLNVLDEAPTSGLTYVFNGFRMFGAVMSSGIISWMGAHGAAVTAQRVEAALAAVRARAGELGAPRLGAIGFCFGAPSALKLAAARKVDAYAVAHPSNVAVPGDLAPLAASGVKGFFALAETDAAFPASAVAAARKLLAGAARFETYAKQHHGFAVRGGAHSVEARRKCAADVCDHFEASLA
jgi:dienelactone hydrolase